MVSGIIRLVEEVREICESVAMAAIPMPSQSIDVQEGEAGVAPYLSHLSWVNQQP